MKKIGIIVDSFTGLSKKEVEELGLEYINHSIILNGESHREGIDIELKDCFEDVKNDFSSKTSMPSIGVVIAKFEELSKIYEQVIYLPMNKGFSSTFSTASAAANDFSNITVVQTKLIARGLIETAIELIKLSNKGLSTKQLIAHIRDVEKTSFSYVIPKDVSALVRGGRLTSAKKLVMQKARLIPRMEVVMEGFKLSKVGRNMSKMIKSTVGKIAKIIDCPVDEYNWEVIHTGNEKTRKMVEDAFSELGITKFFATWASSVIAVHTGVGAIGINVWKK